MFSSLYFGPGSSIGDGGTSAFFKYYGTIVSMGVPAQFSFFMGVPGHIYIYWFYIVLPYGV